MLIDVETGKVIDQVPHHADFAALRSRLSDAEFSAMIELIDEAGSDIATAGWLPESDWTGTPFEPTHSKAAREDFNRSAMLFGQPVWFAAMARPERWASGRFQVDGKDISRTYYRLRS